MMKREDYLNALRSALGSCNEELREDIISEFSAHFDEGRAKGISDDEIINNLGSVEEVAENIIAMYGEENAEEDRGSRNEEGDFPEGEGSLEGEGPLEGEGSPEGEGSLEGEGPLEETGLIVGDIDTIEIEGNLDVEMFPGTNGHWEYRPSSSVEFTLSLLNFFSANKRGFSVNREQFNIEVGITDRTARFILPKGSGRLELEVLPSVRLIRISGRSGDVEISDLNLEELRMEKMSGDYELSHSRIEKAFIKTTGGDVELNEVLGEMRLNSVSGDIRTRRHQGPRLEAESVSGDVEIETTSPFAYAKSTSGDIDIEMNGPLECCQASSVSGDIFFGSASKDYTCQASSVSGDIDNHTELPDSGRGRSRSIGEGKGRVVLKTTSGDISVR